MIDHDNSIIHHNRIITALIRELSELHPSRLVIKSIVTSNSANMKERLMGGGQTTLGVRPLQTLATRINCKLMLVYVPLGDDQTDSTYEMEQLIGEMNGLFYKSLRNRVIEFCSKSSHIEKHKFVKKDAVANIRNIMMNPSSLGEFEVKYTPVDMTVKEAPLKEVNPVETELSASDQSKVDDIRSRMVKQQQQQTLALTVIKPKSEELSNTILGMVSRIREMMVNAA